MPRRSPEPRDWATATRLDAEGELADRFGVRGEAALLVRPAGDLGPRFSPVDDAALWGALARLFDPSRLPGAA